MEALSYHSTIVENGIHNTLVTSLFKLSLRLLKPPFRGRPNKMTYPTALHANDLSFKKESSAISYSPLNKEKDEIRLITFVRESRESSLIHCHLATVSLNSYTSDYQTYIS